MTDEELNEIINALKKKALGNTIETTTEQYEKNKDTKKMELVDKTIKKVQNDIDTQACIKLIDIEYKKRELEKPTNEYENMTDEQLRIEKQRLLALLFEENKNEYHKTK